MDKLPTPVTLYLEEMAVQRYQPAYLRFDSNSNLISAGGALGLFGLTRLNTILEDFPVLSGLLPLEESSIFIPDLQLENGRTADLHLFNEFGSDWAILLDVTDQHQERKKLHQKANELNLIKQQLPKLALTGLNGLQDELKKQLFAHYETQATCKATVLHLKLQVSQEFFHALPDSVLFRAINQFLHQGMQRIIDAGGWVEQLSASGLQIIFGLLPTVQDTHKTALKIAEELRDFQKKAMYFFDAHKGLRPLTHLQIGIVTGTITVGTILNGHQRQISTLGLPIFRAQQLAFMAEPDEILNETLSS